MNILKGRHCIFGSLIDLLADNFYGLGIEKVGKTHNIEVDDFWRDRIQSMVNFYKSVEKQSTNIYQIIRFLKGASLILEPEYITFPFFIGGLDNEESRLPFDNRVFYAGAHIYKPGVVLTNDLNFERIGHAEYCSYLDKEIAKTKEVMAVYTCLTENEAKQLF